MATPRVLALCAFLVVAGCGGQSIVLQSADGSTSPDPGEDASVDVDTAIDSAVVADASCGATCKGCCRSDGTCVTPVSLSECGAEGSACVACGAGEGCNKPVPGCIIQLAVCTPQNCDGCCVLTPAPNVQFCARGTFASACGRGGQACNTCGSGGCTPQDGGGGTCVGQPLCSSASCNGCCINGVCAVGTQDIACGYGGAACGDCNVLGGTCHANGVCK